MLAVVADRCLHLVNGVNHLPLDESSFIASNLWTTSSSSSLLPTTSVENFPELQTHNRSQLRGKLKNNLLSPHHTSFVSDSGIVGSLHSSSSRLSSEYHGSSLPLQMRHPSVATPSPKVDLYAFS
ncbi:Myb-like DNA-binding domain containing protein [Musa troglodytarum]|uniref:Myb-like DNA-binding domain containing protein n=1 Tax=Musa troglodytarum TaxID=320322 RepID=A0A9E7KJ33_9LILI|nr:Myb-like DNA-binding domain containing protein [Musa troglodytarum]